MLHFKHQQIVPYSPKQMFDLVMDIPSYPEFLPWCSNAKIIEQTQDQMLADLTVNFVVLAQTYRSKINTFCLENQEYKIVISSDRNIFDLLDCCWLISADADKTNMQFSMDVQFKSGMLQNLANVFIQNISKEIIDLYQQRAQKIYQHKRS